MDVKSISLALVFTLSCGYAAASSFGDNVAYQSDLVGASKTGKVDMSSNLSDRPVEPMGLDKVQVTDVVDQGLVLNADLWSAQTDDPETEKTIYEYIVRHYKKVPKEDARQIAASIVSSSQEFLIDPFLITALVERESSFRKNAVSYHGARGLGQLMPFNLKPLQVADAFCISQNIRGTTIYVKSMMDKWAAVPDKSLELALASYAEGPNAIRRQNNTWKEKTGVYVKDIVNIYKRFIGTNDLEAKPRILDEE